MPADRALLPKRRRRPRARPRAFGATDRSSSSALAGRSSFADALQTEIEEETGVSFEKRIVDLDKEKVRLTLKPEVLADPIFLERWARIPPRTTYELRFDTQAVIDGAIARIDAIPEIEAIKFRIERNDVAIDESGVSSADVRARTEIEITSSRRLPDIVTELCHRVPLSRRTVVAVRRGCARLEEGKRNPAVFIHQAAAR